LHFQQYLRQNPLDVLRLLSKGKDEPIKEAYQRFNLETDDGNNMGAYSTMLSEAIVSILNTKEESDVDSLFSEGGTSALVNSIQGLEDFELLTFTVIK
ncbi:hypothetical protein BMR07_17620, partial [Methylococcaceae bacterium CS1]